MMKKSPEQRSPQTYDAWYAMGVKRFGKMFAGWRFCCPKCGLAFSAGDAAEVGITDGYQGRLCPLGLSGCGYPYEGDWTRQTLIFRHLKGLVTVMKDRKPSGAYFFFASPAEPAEEAHCS